MVRKQRGCHCRMFMSDPGIFCVRDEPTTGMDAGSKDEFYELMHHSAHHHGKAVLMITHDPEEVSHFADRNIHLVRKQNFHEALLLMSMRKMEVRSML